MSFNNVSAQLTASDAVTAGGDGLALRLLTGRLVRTRVSAFLVGVSGVERQNARGRWVQAVIADGVLTLHPENEDVRALLMAYGWRPEEPDNPGSGLVARK